MASYIFLDEQGPIEVTKSCCTITREGATQATPLSGQIRLTSPLTIDKAGAALITQPFLTDGAGIVLQGFERTNGL
jgi:hypothetical protein